MATRASASAIFSHPIDKVWKELRDFTFPGRYFSTIDSCTIDDGLPPTTVGAIRTLIWKSGERRKHRLIELSDLHFRLVWELVEAEPATEVSAHISTLSLYRVTETNQTLVQWESDFSSDVKNDIILFETKSYLENLKEVRAGLK